MASQGELLHWAKIVCKCAGFLCEEKIPNKCQVFAVVNEKKSRRLKVWFEFPQRHAFCVGRARLFFIVSVNYIVERVEQKRQGKLCTRNRKEEVISCDGDG